MGNSVNDRPTDNTGEAASNRKASANNPSKEITGENAEKLTGREAEAHDLNTSGRGEREQIRKDLLRGMNGADIEKNTGRHNRGIALSNAEDQTKKSKEEKDKVFRAALKQMQERLEWLNKEIAAIDKRLGEIDKELEQSDKRLQELDRLEDRIKSGKIDPNNEADRKLMEKYGIDKEAIDNGTWILLIQQQRNADLDKKNGLNKEKEDLQKRKDEFVRERDEIKALVEDAPKKIQQVKSDDTLSPVEKTKKIFEIERERDKQLVQNSKARNATTRIEETGVVDTTQEAKKSAEVDDVFSRTENEVENFMKKFAQTQKIEDPLARMKKEHELVKILSEEATEIVAWDDKAAKLFEENYFKPLESNVVTTASVPASSLTFS